MAAVHLTAPAGEINMIERMYEFSDPRQIVTASKRELREQCRTLSKMGVRYDSFLAFPAEELAADREADITLEAVAVHHEMRMFAWGRSSIRGCVEPAEIEDFWEYMAPKEELSESERQRLLNALVEGGLWERDEEDALWCYGLCRDFIARSWLTANEMIRALADVVDESKGEPIWGTS